MITYLSLTYPDRATALAVAAALSGNPDVEAFPPDGWLQARDGGGDPVGPPVYYTIAEIAGGMVLAAEDYADPVSGQTIPAGAPVPGYHLLGSYRAEFVDVPHPVRDAHVIRPDWWPQMDQPGYRPDPPL